jgi:hypothetical protein
MPLNAIFELLTDPLKSFRYTVGRPAEPLSDLSRLLVLTVTSLAQLLSPRIELIYTSLQMLQTVQLGC